jgi:hypothetical protein
MSARALIMGDEGRSMMTCRNTVRMGVGAVPDAFFCRLGGIAYVVVRSFPNSGDGFWLLWMTQPGSMCIQNRATLKYSLVPLCGVM